MEDITLKKDDDGNTIQVVTTTQITEVPLSSEELQRQIDEHQAIIDRLQAQYKAVKGFEESNQLEAILSVTLEEK